MRRNAIRHDRGGRGVPERLDDVHQRILGDHEEIRARLRGLGAHAERTDLPWAVQALRVQLLRFAAEFEDHLAFEERELVPHVRVLDAWGPAREEALLDEHRAQRRHLEYVCALAEVPEGIVAHALANAVIELASELLDDMEGEERWLCELAGIDESGHPQMTG